MLLRQPRNQSPSLPHLPAESPLLVSLVLANTQTVAGSSWASTSHPHPLNSPYPMLEVPFLEATFHDPLVIRARCAHSMCNGIRIILFAFLPTQKWRICSMRLSIFSLNSQQFTSLTWREHVKKKKKNLLMDALPHLKFNSGLIATKKVEAFYKDIQSLPSSSGPILALSSTLPSGYSSKTAPTHYSLCFPALSWPYGFIFAIPSMGTTLHP